jgi:hypothetical protein
MARHTRAMQQRGAHDAVVAAAQPLNRWAKEARKVLPAAPSRIGLRRRNGETSPRRQHALAEPRRRARGVSDERTTVPLCTREVLGSRAGRTVGWQLGTHTWLWVPKTRSRLGSGGSRVSLDRPGFVGSGQRAGREGREMSSFTSTLAILSPTVVTDQRATTPSRKQQAARRRMSTKRRPALPAFVNITLGASRESGTRRSRASAPSHRRDSGCRRPARRRARSAPRSSGRSLVA